ncbi:MAG: hypothetical protein HY369_00665 [Candidatus Aenigmarchaeota archaeon]|nr:hypothetical protein [Candidatus Aenigmarchaeota archaeon]
MGLPTKAVAIVVLLFLGLSLAFPSAAFSSFSSDQPATAGEPQSWKPPVSSLNGPFSVAGVPSISSPQQGERYQPRLPRFDNATVRKLAPEEVAAIAQEDSLFRDMQAYAQELGFPAAGKAVEISTPGTVVTLQLFFSENGSVLYLMRSLDTEQGMQGSALFDFHKENGTTLMRLFSREGRIDIDVVNRKVVNAPGQQESQVSCSTSVCQGYALEWGFYYNDFCINEICSPGFYQLLDILISLSAWFGGTAPTEYNPLVDTADYFYGDLYDLTLEVSQTYACANAQVILSSLDAMAATLPTLDDYDDSAAFILQLNDLVVQEISGKCIPAADVGLYDTLTIIQDTADVADVILQLDDVASKTAFLQVAGSALLEGLGFKIVFDALACSFCVYPSVVAAVAACSVNPCGFYPCQTVCAAQDYSFSSPFCQDGDQYDLIHDYHYSCSSAVPTEGICILDATISEELVEACPFGCDVATGQCTANCGTGVPGATELCNGVDDNCDGSVDEGCSCISGQTQACGTDTGACSLGTQTCTSGQWGSCTGGQGPVAEVCPHDGIDTDCDGQADENICGGDGNECYDWSVVVNEPPYSGYVDTIQYGPYCANGYQWHYGNVDTDEYLEHYILTGDTYKAWFRCEVKSGYTVSDIVNFAYTKSYGCYDGTCDQKAEKTVTVTKTYPNQLDHVDFPDVLCLSSYPPGDPYGYGFYGGDLWEYWDTNGNGQFDVGEHSEKYLVLNCGADADCGPGKYCHKPDNNPLSNTCVSCLQAEICNDGFDNDCDGFVDCADGQCGLGTPAKNGGFCCGSSCSVNGGECVAASPGGMTCSDGSCNAYGEACRNGELESSLLCAGTGLSCSGGTCEFGFGAPASCDELAPGEDTCEAGGQFNERACEAAGTDCALSAETACDAPASCDESLGGQCSPLPGLRCDWQGAGDDVVEVCAAACGASAACDGALPGSAIPSCSTDKPYFGDTCSSLCTAGDAGFTCRSSLFAPGCTADPFCEGVIAGTGGCTIDCEKNNPPSAPTALTCDAGSCSSTFNGAATVSCSGSSDQDGHPFFYEIEARSLSPTTEICTTVTLSDPLPQPVARTKVPVFLDLPSLPEADPTLRVRKGSCSETGEEVPSFVSEARGVVTFLADLDGVAHYAVITNTSLGPPSYPGNVVAGTNTISWAPDTFVTINCPSSTGRVTCSHHYPGFDLLSNTFDGAGGNATFSFYSGTQWETFTFTLQEGSPFYAFYNATSSADPNWVAEIHVWSDADPVVVVKRMNSPITKADVRFLDVRYFNSSFGHWIYMNVSGALTMVPFSNSVIHPLGSPALAALLNNQTSQTLLFLPSPQTASLLPQTATGFCAGYQNSCNYAFTSSSPVTIQPGDTFSLSLKYLAAVDYANPQTILDLAQASAAPPLVSVDASTSWALIGSHANDSAFTWNLSAYPDGTTFELRCRATDAFGGSSPYYEPDTELTVVNNLPPVLSPPGGLVIPENQTLSLYLQATDPDNDTLTFTTDALAVLPGQPAFDPQAGLFTWTPGFTDADTYPVTFTVTDGQLSDEETILIAVTDVNIATLAVSGTPQKLGTITYALSDLGNPGALFLLLFSLGSSPGIPLGDGRTVPLNYDSTFQLSLQTPALFGLNNSVAFLDATGSSQATWTIPGYVPVNTTLYAAYVTIDPALPFPQSILSVSNPVNVTIVAAP